MTDNRKRVTIPKDIQPGDVLVLRDGQTRRFALWQSDGYAVCSGVTPKVFEPGGSWRGMSTRLDWDVVAIERKTKTKPKPVRDDKDAVWLMNKLWLAVPIPKRVAYRIRAIARRLNGGKAVDRA